MKYKIGDFVRLKENGVYYQVLGYEESSSKMVLLNKPLQETKSIFYHLNDGNWYDEKDLSDKKEEVKKIKAVFEVEEEIVLNTYIKGLENLFSNIFNNVNVRR